MTKKNGCLYSLIGFALFLLACSIAWHIFVWYHFPPKGKKYTPVVNPHPKYFLTVSGFIDPSLKDKLHVTFRANYYTTNKACMASFSAGDAFDGIESYRERNIYFKATPNTAGHFRLKIPLDKYLPGFCQWQPLAADYKIHGIGINGIITYFSNKPLDLQKKTASQNIICKNLKNCTWGHRLAFRGTQVYFKSKYHYKLKIVMKE